MLCTHNTYDIRKNVATEGKKFDIKSIFEKKGFYGVGLKEYKTYSLFGDFKAGPTTEVYVEGNIFMEIEKKIKEIDEEIAERKTKIEKNKNISQEQQIAILKKEKEKLLEKLKQEKEQRKILPEYIEEQHHNEGTPLIEFFYRIQIGDIETIKSILKKNPELINSFNESGTLAIFEACCRDDVNCIELLIKAGADVNLQPPPNNKSALMWAAQTGAVNSIKRLLEEGAEINATDGEKGWTPLMFAACFNYENCIDILLNAGADVEKLDSNGNDISEINRLGPLYYYDCCSKENTNT